MKQFLCKQCGRYVGAESAINSYTSNFTCESCAFCIPRLSNTQDLINAREKDIEDLRKSIEELRMKQQTCRHSFSSPVSKLCNAGRWHYDLKGDEYINKPVEHWIRICTTCGIEVDAKKCKECGSFLDHYADAGHR